MTCVVQNITEIRLCMVLAYLGTAHYITPFTAIGVKSMW